MLRVCRARLSAQKLLVKQRMREREGKEFIPGRVIWDELTFSGPGNWPIEPPEPMMGAMGWREFFHMRGLYNCNVDFDTALFAFRVHVAIQEELAKIEKKPPPLADHHVKGGKLLLVHSHIDCERAPQTKASIPKDKYELESYVDWKIGAKESDHYVTDVNYEWQQQQAIMFNSSVAGIVSEDARMWDNIMGEEEFGKAFGGAVAHCFVFGWAGMVFLSLIWRTK